jgi:type I restriction enzyme, S subunit
MEKQVNKPKLRFPEFEGEWEIKKLAEVAEKRIVKNKDNKIKNVFTNSAVQGIVNQRDFFEKDIANQNNLLGYYIVEHNDFVYNPRISTYAPVGPISRNKLQSGIMSPLYSVFRFNIGNIDFVEHFFSTTKWHIHMENIANYGARDDRMSFSVGDFYKMPIPLPNLKEQTKIATFLTTVDDKLQALKKKKTLLAQHKKGVMQKIFSQELRFKDDNGNEYPIWEEKKLREVANKKSSNISANKIEDNFGDYLIYGASGILKKVDFYKEEDDYISIIKDGAGVGRLLYCKGQSSVLGTMEIIRPNEGLNTYYLYCLLSNIDFVKYVTGSTIPHIYFKDYSSEICGLPCLEEQTKIATFLSAIDDKVQAVEAQIEKMEVWKKGLLQQMFC